MSQPILTCCDKSDALSNDVLRAVLLAQTETLHKKSSERQLKQKKGDGPRQNSDAFR